MIFVFGSNEAGIHGAGAAHYAYMHHGAIWKHGKGHYGNSYAIPTKAWNIQTLPLQQIKAYVDEFLEYARAHPELQFQVTRIGCGLAGYKPSDIQPMFERAPVNCIMPDWNSTTF